MLYQNVVFVLKTESETKIIDWSSVKLNVMGLLILNADNIVIFVILES